MDRKERSDVKFSRWTPNKTDNHIGFYPEGTTMRHTGTNRWQQAKSRMAQHALCTGESRYTVFGGLGNRRWRRTVVVTQEDAQAFFEQAIANGYFMLKGMYAQAMKRKGQRESTTS